MYRRLFIGIFLLLCLTSVANAQYIIIGPPDDQTIVDTSIHPSPAPARLKPFDATASPGTVTSLDLSQLDCSQFPSICAYVDVLDGSGNPISGLNPDSFCVFQNGVPIPSFTVQQLTAGNCITSVCLVVDISGSMTTDHRLDSAKSAMHRFVNNMDTYDQVAIVTFSSCWSLLINFTSNKTSLHNAINGLSANGNTAAFDGIYKGVDFARFQLGSKAVIAFTDGVENRSHLCAPNPPDGVTDNTYSDDSTAIVNLANSAGVPIYTFNLGPIDTTWFNPYALQKFANATGGFWSHAPTGAAIDSLYSKIKQRLCSRYYICYQSTDTIANGDIHWTKICKKTGPNCTLCDSASCQETAPPVIVRTPATINLSNSCQSTTSPASICAYVTDLDTPKASLVVTLYYRTGPSSYTSITMTPTGAPTDSTFCASIPISALKCQTFVDYYITASDGQATVSSPQVNPQVSPHNFALCPNHPPTANAGADQFVFQCAPAQLCWAASCSDVDGNLKSCVLFSGPGTYNGSQICFTPNTTMNYEFVLKATDSCDAVGYDTVVIHYTLNSAPVANAGRDSTLFLCTPQEICWTAGCTDPNNNLSTCQLLSGPGTYNGSQICFTPPSSGSYQFVLKATDSCGLTSQDTSIINVTINSAPVCIVPNETTFAQCAPTQVCLPYSATDVNGNFRSCQIVSGPGSLVGGNWCYTPSTTQNVTVTIHCDDSCNAYCESSFTVHFLVNQPPTIAFGNDTSLFLCASQQICLSYTVSDADNNVNLEQLVSGPGTIDTGANTVCFTPVASGTYTFVVRAQDTCLTQDLDTINVTVALNQKPIAGAGADQNLFLCSATQICWPASVSDPNGNLQSSALTGPGSFDGSQICFTPAASGIYTFVLAATDSCGEQAADTVSIQVTLNGAPTIAFGNDTTISLCSSQQFCFGYAVSDPNGPGSIVETMVSGFGAIDTSLNQICFTPAVSGTYQFIVRATDSCGAYDNDTISVTVTIGAVADISCPPGPIAVSLCAPGQVCQMIAITPGTANVTTSLGTYSAGQLCFNAPTSGTYNATLIASTPCGADTCLVTFNVTIGSAPQLTCPGVTSKFLCTAGQVCIPIGVVGGGTVSVLPIGSYNSGDVCFTADSSGHYVLTVIASGTCGADTCTLEANVQINSHPVATNPPANIDTFLCAGAQICRQFAASDPNGGALTWSRLSGAGTVTAGGLWCFTANTSGIYSVVVAVADSCGAADTVSMQYTVAINTAPIVQFGNDTTLFQCANAQFCVPYTVTDPNGNVTLEQLFVGTGSIDTAANTVCFTPAGAGTYTFVVKATDACGATDVDTIVVTITANHAPVANAGPDQVLKLCTPTQVCWPASCTDPDGNLDSCKLIGGPGTYAGGQICFTPGASGSYTFITRAVDHCGIADQDTAIITITLNAPPVCHMPPAETTLVVQCAPAQISLPVGATDPNGNFSHCELVTGPGSLVGGNWVFTPTVDQLVKVKVQCSDSCGAFCVDSFFVKINLNAAPVANAGRDTSVFVCSTKTICVAAGCTDEDHNLSSCELISPFGSYDSNTGQICLTVNNGDGSDKTYQLILKATDSCGAVDFDTSIVSVNMNAAPAISAPSDFTAYLDAIGPVCFDITVNDPDANLASVTVSPFGTYNAGHVCFDADSTGVYCLVLTATDQCGLTDKDTVCVNVQIDECFHVQIEKVHDAMQGQHSLVDIFLNSSGKPVGGFSFLIAYDNSALFPSTVTPGALLTGCSWEYFTFRFGANGNCGNACPSGLLSVTALAETNNGAYHPGCYLDGQVGTLATLDFLVSNDRTLECQYAPVRFFWLECGDNTFSSKYGDTLWISRNVYDLELNNITNTSYSLPGYYGAPNECLVPGGKGLPQRCIDFTNGGIDIVCADSIDARGDINLNDLPYEIADVVMFTQYFIKGLAAFPRDCPGCIPPTYATQGAIAASDVNADGVPLTVGDLVYLIRVVVGDAAPYEKLNPNAGYEATVAVSGTTVRVSESNVRLAGAQIVVEGDVTPTLGSAARDMELQYSFDGTVTRILVFSSNHKASLQTGELLNLGGQFTVKSVDLGAVDGSVVVARLSSLPSEYSLSQNYPNPFNPVTRINFALPEAGKWKLDVYNILGQTVNSFEGEDQAGYYQVTWDASAYASGVYFYRLSSGTYSATKKMVLLK